MQFPGTLPKLTCKFCMRALLTPIIINPIQNIKGILTYIFSSKGKKRPLFNAYFIPPLFQIALSTCIYLVPSCFDYISRSHLAATGALRAVGVCESQTYLSPKRFYCEVIKDFRHMVSDIHVHFYHVFLLGLSPACSPYNNYSTNEKNKAGAWSLVLAEGSVLFIMSVYL